MPDDPATSPPSGKPGRYVGTGLAGETTRGQDSTLRFEPNQPLEIIGDFEVLAKLGQGGMGSVYRARQVSLDRQVALKILPSNFEADADYVARFQREARVAANLKHPNLVRVYTSGVAAGSHFIAMELIEGETLAGWIKRGPLPPFEALRIVLDVARALECGWRTAQLIHRDIKPGNIFLSQEGEVKLGDLGLAKLVGESTTGLTQTGAAMGTPHYISPEQARGDKDLDFRADIYSLGCTLYQMLTQQTPYSGSDAVTIFHHHIHSPPPAILKVLPQCPLPLARLVAKMLKKQRRERFGSYEELIAQIESVRAQLDPGRAATIVTRSPAPEPAEVGTPRRGVVGEGTAADAEGRRGAPSLPPKPKLPLYGGIAAGVAVLGVIAWLVWPKEEKLTAAQRYAREHASDFKASAETAAETATVLASLNDATKDAPFVNTLGMKFVPVPIIRGPTGGQRVLFSAWDTRVQDYEAFVKETKRESPKPDFEQGPTHPAVNVSWEDAQLFCQWLTAREHLAGKLSAGWSYRLPGDHEWSCAVELGAREDAARLPTDKSQRINDVFPWGTEWPPPAKAGNYWSEELRPLLAVANYSWIKGELPGRRDGYATTSPVGSFPANAYGLYDMGGNVWQWCEDWFDKEQNDRVLRGASWLNYDRIDLLSSRRYHNVPGHRYYHYGFRCVLAPVAAPAGGTRSVVSQTSPNAGGQSAVTGVSDPGGPASLGPATTTPRTAAKDTPFVNSLGMKFVPVPIIGGPTSGQSVLFSVWDTRVQDYEVFAKGTKREWPKPNFEQGPTHTVVHMSWEDAQAFCQWLTQREQAAGRLPPAWRYRLPHDHEWSCAVGIGDREDAARLPLWKNDSLDDVFPWGTQWPPPERAGNYASEELRPLLAGGKYPYVGNVIANYHDGYANTSPVGSYAPNHFGLYDMGGNVWQWCEDWFDNDQQERVQRGASWAHSDRGNLRSSRRLHSKPNYHFDTFGFRCVLSASAPAEGRTPARP